MPQTTQSDHDDAPRRHRFMAIELELGPGVLVPRQETELLGTQAAFILRQQPPGARVIDMCCGSGNLALAIAAHISSVEIWAADLTDSAVGFARRNAERLGYQDRVQIRQGDLFGALKADDLEGRIDMVVCNPPYISAARLEGESAHLLQAEPREAFDGGPYGISIHQRVIRDAVAFLKPGGWLLFEFGEGQHRQAEALIARTKAYDAVSFALNPASTPRVAMVRKRAEPAGRPATTDQPA